MDSTPCTSEEQFQIISQFSSDLRKSNEKQFMKEKSKNLHIFQKEILVISLDDSHLHDFIDTIELFKTKYFFLPPHIDANSVIAIVRYFYFREIPPIPIKGVFSLLQAAIIMKVSEIIVKIKDFLIKYNVDPQSAFNVLEQCLDFFSFSIENDNELKCILNRLMVNSSISLLKNEKPKVFFDVLQKDHVSKIKKNTEIFDLILIEAMNQNWVSLTVKADFILIFKESLLSSFMNDKSRAEDQLRKVIEQKLDLRIYHPIEVFDFWQRLGLLNPKEMEETILRIIKENSDQITDVKKKILEKEEKERLPIEKIKERQKEDSAYVNHCLKEDKIAFFENLIKKTEDEIKVVYNNKIDELKETFNNKIEEMVLLNKQYKKKKIKKLEKKMKDLESGFGSLSEKLDWVISEYQNNKNVRQTLKQQKKDESFEENCDEKNKLRESETIDKENVDMEDETLTKNEFFCFYEEKILPKINDFDQYIKGTDSYIDKLEHLFDKKIKKLKDDFGILPKISELFFSEQPQYNKDLENVEIESQLKRNNDIEKTNLQNFEGKIMENIKKKPGSQEAGLQGNDKKLEQILL